MKKSKKDRSVSHPSLTREDIEQCSLLSSMGSACELKACKKKLDELLDIICCGVLPAVTSEDLKFHVETRMNMTCIRIIADAPGSDGERDAEDGRLCFVSTYGDISDWLKRDKKKKRRKLTSMTAEERDLRAEVHTKCKLLYEIFSGKEHMLSLDCMNVSRKSASLFTSNVESMTWRLTFKRVDSLEELELELELELAVAVFLV